MQAGMGMHEDDSIFGFMEDVVSIASTTSEHDHDHDHDTLPDNVPDALPDTDTVPDTVPDTIPDTVPHSLPGPLQDERASHSDLGADTNLCGWFNPTLEQNEQKQITESSESWDSQLTQMRPVIPDPVVPVVPALSSNTPHFTRDVEFWDKAFAQTQCYIDEPWIVAAPSLDALSPDWANNCDVCANAIRSVVATASEFKIGICLDPRWRYFNIGGGEYADRFTKMVLIYVSPWSNPYKSESTGAMEIELIARFKHYESCLNEKPGGEGVSTKSFAPVMGGVHFLYVVYN